MTFLVKAKQLGAMLNKHGIPLRCPYTLGLETNNPDCRLMTCTECWNREIPK